MNFDAEFGQQYDNISRRSIPGYELLFRMSKDFLDSKLPANAEILVVGAGGGSEIITFGSAHPGWHFVGVDPAAQMIAAAQYKTDQQGMTDRVRLMRGFAHDLPADLRADAATCILVFPFVHGDEAKLAVLKEISARLKPDAPLIIATVYGDGWNDDFFSLWRAFQADNGSTPAEIAATEASVRASVQPIPEARLLDLLSEAGFTDPLPFYRALWFAGWFVTKKSIEV